MAKSFATLIDEVQSALQDDGTEYTDAVVTIKLEDAIKEVSEYDQYEMMETFKIESRTGTADENKPNALVDDASLQFLATDVGKEIYNTDDRTWAVVTAFVDTGELTLSKDIFPDGDEDYAMFNKGCRSNKQINIEDVTDFVDPPEHGVARGYVEHPLGDKRNFTIEGDILTVDVDSVDDSADTDADVEVFVWFNKRHRVSQLTDLLGTVNGAVSAGAKTLTVAAIGSGTETIAEDTLFRVDISSAVTEYIRGTYRVTADKALTGGGGAILFWPGLESAVGNTAIITFIGSTLNTRLERLVVELAAAKCEISKAQLAAVLAAADLASGRALINTVPKGGLDVPYKYISSSTGELATARKREESGRNRLAIVLNELEKLRRQRMPVTKHVYHKD